MSSSDVGHDDRVRRRIVSLVPSLTETIFALGKGDCLVGRTRYCVEPSERVQAVEAVGGTKNPDVARIIELRPDLVVVNREENRREDFERLVDAGLSVYVTHPRTVQQAIAMFDELGVVLGAEAAASELAASCLQAIDRVRRRGARRPAVRVFCPIWRNPWMTFTGVTYLSSVLATCGMENVFASADEIDFFEVSLERVVRAAPDLVVLPDEPYVFDPRHGLELQAAGVQASFVCIDGKDLSWYGPRLPRALERLRAIADRARNPQGRAGGNADGSHKAGR